MLRKHPPFFLVICSLVWALVGCSLITSAKDIAPDTRRTFVTPLAEVDLRAVSEGVRLFGVSREDPGSLGGMTGLSLAFGDFDGDGKKDLAVGAPSFPEIYEADSGPSGPGGVYLLLGRTDVPTLNELPQAADLILVAGETSAGYSMIFEDLNGDGLDDLVIGAPWGSGFVPLRRDQVGVVAVVFGRRDLEGTHPIPEVANVLISGAHNQDFSGAALSAGDFNGDGAPDLLVGAPMDLALGTFERRNSGAAYLILGRSQWSEKIDLARDADITMVGVYSRERLGSAVALRDVTGDGLADAIVGAPLAGWFLDDRPLRRECGAVYVLRGRREVPERVDLATEADVTIYGTEEGDAAGWSLVAGDFNGDGTADIIIGAPLARHSNVRRKEDVHDLIGGNTRTSLGVAAARRRVSGHAEGEVYVIFGRPDLPTQIDLASQTNITLYGPPFEMTEEVFIIQEAGGDSGYALALGNLDGDGRMDLVVGSPFADGREPFRKDSGTIHVVFGSNRLLGTTALSEASSFRVMGSNDDYRLGTTVALGDFNGDGKDEIAVTEPRASELDTEGTVRGRVYLIEGVPERELLRPHM